MNTEEQVYLVVSDTENETNRAYVGVVGGAIKEYLFNLNFKILFGSIDDCYLNTIIEQHLTPVDRVDMFAGSNTVVIRVV